jgi:hypothetical protein
MARGMKGGNVLSALEIGAAVFAAKKSSTFGGFVWTFLKYIFLIFVGLFVLSVVLYALGLIKREHFVPVAPSKEGDEKVRTPAGNVIMY